MRIEFPDDINRMSDIVLMIIIFILSKKNNIPLMFLLKFKLSIFIINPVLKYLIFRPILGDKIFPLIGRGTRPDGAKNCSIIRENLFNNKIISKISTSYGFPSGHSQSAGFFMAFIYKFFKNDKMILYLSLVYSLYIPYTRVQLGCHTIQQTIFGYIFGVIVFNILDKIPFKF